MLCKLSNYNMLLGWDLIEAKYGAKRFHCFINQDEVRLA